MMLLRENTNASFGVSFEVGSLGSLRWEIGLKGFYSSLDDCFLMRLQIYSVYLGRFNIIHSDFSPFFSKRVAQALSYSFRAPRSSSTSSRALHFVHYFSFPSFVAFSAFWGQCSLLMK